MVLERGLQYYPPGPLPSIPQTAPVDLWALAELLKEENASLKKHVEYYYSRAKKLQKVRTADNELRWSAHTS